MTEARKIFLNELSDVTALADTMAPKARRDALNQIVRDLEARNVTAFGDFTFEALGFTDQQWNVIVTRTRMMRGASDAERY